jgi:hypothetical protein
MWCEAVSQVSHTCHLVTHRGRQGADSSVPHNNHPLKEAGEALPRCGARTVRVIIVRWHLVCPPALLRLLKAYKPSTAQCHCWRHWLPQCRQSRLINILKWAKVRVLHFDGAVAQPYLLNVSNTSSLSLTTTFSHLCRCKTFRLKMCCTHIKESTEKKCQKMYCDLCIQKRCVPTPRPQALLFGKETNKC